MTIVDRIYLLLEKNNTTGKELAKYVGLSAGTVSDWKNKGTFPSSKYIEKITDFFNTNAQFLITGETIETEYDFSDTDLELINLFNSLDKKQQAIITGKLLEYEYDNKKAQIKEHNKQLKVAESKNILQTLK